MDPIKQQLLDYVTSLAKELLHPRTIILFGSRARGDYRPNSDYDIAIEFDPVYYGKNWGRFVSEIQENAPTLMSIDMVNMNDISDEFIKKIHKEGIVFYKEKNK